MYENDAIESSEYQEWAEGLLTPDELSKKLSRLFKRRITVRTIAKERKLGMPVGTVVRGKAMYDLDEVIAYFKKNAEKENSSKTKRAKGRQV